MNNNRGGERTIYDESLFRIFLWSGFPIFMILLFACVAISGIVFIYRHSDPEGVKIIIFCFDFRKYWNGPIKKGGRK